MTAWGQRHGLFRFHSPLYPRDGSIIGSRFIFTPCWTWWTWELRLNWKSLVFKLQMSVRRYKQMSQCVVSDYPAFETERRPTWQKCWEKCLHGIRWSWRNRQGNVMKGHSKEYRFDPKCKWCFSYIASSSRWKLETRCSSCLAKLPSGSLKTLPVGITNMIFKFNVTQNWLLGNTVLWN